MAKPLPLFIGVLGVGATATGGILLMGKKGSGEGTGTSATTTGGSETPASGEGAGQRTDNAATQNGQLQQAAEQNLIFDGIAAFKGSPTTSDCLKTNWTGLTSLSGGEDFADGKPDTNTFFKQAEGTAPGTKSCLVINWKKSKSADKKWNGKFTWLWTFQTDKEGFVTFNVMEPATTDGKVKFTGVFYLVEKADNGGNWSVKYKKEVETTATEVDKNTLDDYFPKAGEDIKATVAGLKDYWGLIDTKDKLGELCKGESECSKVEVKELQWTAAAADAAENKTLKDWSVDLKWWEKIYDVKTKWDFDAKIANFKGKWALKPATPVAS